MLNKLAILTEIELGNIRIAYSFLPNNDAELTTFAYHDPPRSPGDDQSAKEFLLRNVVRNRVGLTLGPIIRLYRPTSLRANLRFGGHNKIVDLRKCPQGFFLQPGESGFAYTNEFVELNNDLAGIVLSRVTNYFTSLTIHSSYIDSTWSGLLKLIIRNDTNKPLRVRIGMPIARVFLFRCGASDEPSDELKLASPHLGYNWRLILNDGYDPFIDTGGTPTSHDRLSAFWAQYKRVVGVSAISLVGLIAFGSYGLDVYQNLVQLSTIRQDVDNLENVNSDITSRVSDVERRQVITGKSRLMFNSGQSTITRAITLDSSLEDRQYSMVMVRPVFGNLEGVSFDAYIEYDSTVNLIITGRADSPIPEDTTIDVYWAIFP